MLIRYLPRLTGNGTKAAICEHQLSAISPSVVDDSCAEYLAQQPGRGLNVEHCETDMISSPYSAEHGGFLLMAAPERRRSAGSTLVRIPP